MPGDSIDRASDSSRKPAMDTIIAFALANASSKSRSRPAVTCNNACSVIIGPVSHEVILHGSGQLPLPEATVLSGPAIPAGADRFAGVVAEHESGGWSSLLTRRQALQDRTEQH